VTYENFTYFLCSTVAEYNTNVDDVGLYMFSMSDIISLRHRSIIDTYGRWSDWVEITSI